MSMKKYEEWNANHKHDNPPREKIVKLGRKITDVAGHIFGGVKVEDPEYWGLAEIVSDEMADRDIKATTLPLPMKAIVCGVDCSFLAVMLH